MSDLFGGALPKQAHPAARITWCGYPSPEGEPPAQGCLSWKAGTVSEPVDCMGCMHCIGPAGATPRADGGG
jgi:hypothetical protein